jgi:hypothetical protein
MRAPRWWMDHLDDVVERDLGMIRKRYESSACLSLCSGYRDRPAIRCTLQAGVVGQCRERERRARSVGRATGQRIAGATL